VIDLRNARVLSAFAVAAARLGLKPERRNSYRLPGLQSILRLRALAVHPQLAFADDALDMGEREPGESCLEKAVHPHAGFVAADRDRLHVGRRRGRGLGQGRMLPWHDLPCHGGHEDFNAVAGRGV